MKKLVVAVGLLLGSFNMFATADVENTNVETSIMVKQEGYKEIQVSDLPSAVTKAFEKDFPGGTIDKAYVNTEKKYKLEVTTAEMSTTLYANEKGEWIEE
ncbi:hypothetical protein SAMN05216480_101352 [Pustulibacterium marinum]|uniref:Beta-lactamase-inhibitor-like, PepSY-like n=1 Tax=Pustulibacterium marinum TaxID=1224947 RepID=A0A1I7EWL5_9FLAO|nr:hypothetical protein [Pustulibacterium marinum]SFU28350.1 hypothetical protein SAMN05216480_101352 [Pustulibacterium marinum]